MNGGKIKITDSTGSAIGDLICKHDHEKNLFGARIDIVKPAVVDCSAGPVSVGKWTSSGHFPVESRLLSEAEIRAIKECDSVGCQFTLDLDTNK